MGHSVTTYVSAIGMTYSLNSNKKGWKRGMFFFAYMLVGLAGGKRAIIVLAPIIYVMSNIKFKLSTSAVTRLLTIPIVVFLTVNLISAILPTLNNDQKVGGDVDLSYTKDYIISYSTNINSDGQSTGRISSLYKGLNSLSVGEFFFGKGAGTFIRSRYVSSEDVASSIGIEYGLGSLLWWIIYYGIIPLVVYYWIHLVVVREALMYSNLNETYLIKVMVIFLLGYSLFYSPVLKSFEIMAPFYLLVGSKLQSQRTTFRHR